MIIVTLRIICLILLIFSIIVDIDIPLILHTQVNQLIIAILIIVVLLVIDEIVGFLLGLIFLIIYFKYYQKKLNNPIVTNNQSSLKEPLIADKFNNNLIDVKPASNQKTEPIENHYIKEGYNCLEMPYISKELLEKAQNNIYDINNYNTNIEIQGLLNEPIQAYDGSHYSKL